MQGRRMTSQSLGLAVLKRTRLPKIASNFHWLKNLRIASLATSHWLALFQEFSTQFHWSEMRHRNPSAL